MRKARFHGHLKNDANPGILIERKNRHQAAALPLLAAPLWCRPLSPSHGDIFPMTTTLILCALLASGLALALSREHRVRRAFQALANRVLAKLHERSESGFISRPQHHTRPPHSRRRS